MATPIVAPTVPTYASRTSYLTPEEYIASPTGVDVSQLVVGGTTQQNADALLQTIARASSAVDEFCKQVIAATLDTQAGIYRVTRDGVIKIKLDNTPIVQINDVAVGINPNALTSLTDLSGVWVGKKVIEVPVTNLSVPPVVGSPGYGRLYAVTKYVNGFANALLTSATTAGGNTCVVDNALGFFPGLQITAYDPGTTESQTVLSVSGNTVTIDGTWTSVHAVGVSISALPPKVKEAAVLYTTALIKERTDDSFIMPALGSEPSQMTGAKGIGGELIAEAQNLLMSLRRTI